MDEVIQGSAGRGTVIALIADLFFSVTVRNTVRRLGYAPRIVKSVDELTVVIDDIDAALVVVDLGAVRSAADWDIITAIAEAAAPILAFGTHKDVEGLRRAKAAGVTRVVSNGEFHREMPHLIERYARSTEPLDTDRVEVANLDEYYGSLPPGTSGQPA